MKMSRKRLLSVVSLTAITVQAIAPAMVFAAPLKPNDDNTTTPVKHVIVIYGENRSFDHLYATYKPVSKDSVRNVLSEGIIKADGTPGPNFGKTTQYKANVTKTYSLSPDGSKQPYHTLPPPSTDGTPQTQSDTSPPFKTLLEAYNYDQGLLPRDLRLVTTGASGLPGKTIDTRIHNVNSLPPGPFQLTPGVRYDDYAASPVHRYYQDYQQQDCSVSHATPDDPSGCLKDLFPWVEVSVGAGTNGKPQPNPFTDETTGEGATSMGFYNMQQGDAAFTKLLSDRYTISDNYHQPGKGGTGLDSILAGFADGIWYSDGKGNPAKPPDNQIENPNPQPGTNNWYAQDGYSGGSYSKCADPSEPGVGPVTDYLNALKVPVKCEADHYYLLNNYSPGYYANGQAAPTGPDQFVIPPSPVRSIGDVLLDNSVSFAWFAEGWNAAVANPGAYTGYCDICNFLNYQSRFMSDPVLRGTYNKDLSDLDTALATGTLPAVAFVKPSGINDGHPASSKWDLFEGFVRKILVELRANPDLAETTAVFITTDEGGGYWDSSYIQQLDFFGDGVRIPLIVVSPWTHGGHVNHEYTDHVSILKFIEKNWGLPTITARSRDNLPNPKQDSAHPYVPVNGPAVGDLMGMFDFDHPRHHHHDTDDGQPGTNPPIDD